MHLIPLETLWTLIVTAVVTSLVGALVGGGYARLKGMGEKSFQTNSAIKEAVRLILEDKVEHLTDKAVSDGSITTKQRALIVEMVDVAHDLGANGRMTACKNIVKDLPLRASNQYLLTKEGKNERMD